LYRSTPTNLGGHGVRTDRSSTIAQEGDGARVHGLLSPSPRQLLHGIPRFTEDIDLFVDAAEANVACLRRALSRLWQDPEIEKIRAEDLAGDYAVVRYGTPDGFAIDLVSRIGGRFDSPTSRARSCESATWRFVSRQGR